MPTDLRQLLNRLSPVALHSLETAAGVCLTRTHYEVTVEHWAAQLLEDRVNDWGTLLRDCVASVDAARTAVRRSLDRLPTGNTNKPVFHPRLIDWMQDSWLIASLEMGESVIQSGALLRALVARPERYVDGPVADAFRSLPSSPTATAFRAAVAGSAETPAPSAAPAGGPASASGRFCEDFTRKARDGRLDPVFARDAEIAQMIDILARRRKNNPLLVGEAGVGKTAVVEGLALRMVQGDVPSFLRGVTLLSLDLGALQAGAGVRGEFENRLKSVVDEIRTSPTPTILFIDEAHTLIGAGGPAGGGDAANLLKPVLARGELRTIAATTWAEYKKYFEKDAALARRFQPVKIDEPSVENTVHILQGLKSAYEKAHGVVFQDAALTAAAELSRRFLPDRQLPDKAVDLMDTAGARLKVRATSAGASSAEGSPAAPPPAVDADTIARIVSDWTGVPLGQVFRDEAANLASLETDLERRICGQSPAIAAIARGLRAAKAGLGDPAQPLGVFLCVGPSGVGKTETALAVADQLFGGARSVVTINMTEFQESHSVSRLIGSPPGYVGYGEGGVLTEAVRRRPYSVVLIDEAEKGHRDILNLFYQVFDKGTLSDGEGRAIDFRNTAFFLTSNAAAERIDRLFADGRRPDAEEAAAAIRPDLMRFFPLPLLARMTVVPFAPLGEEELKRIASMKLARLSVRARESSRVNLTFADEVLGRIAELCRSTDAGARAVDHVLRSTLIPLVSREVLVRLGKTDGDAELRVALSADGTFAVNAPLEERHETSALP